jgi:hypothetical protein
MPDVAEMAGNGDGQIRLMIGFRNLRQLSKLGDADFYAVIFEQRREYLDGRLRQFTMIDRSS